MTSFGLSIQQERFHFSLFILKTVWGCCCQLFRLVSWQLTCSRKLNARVHWKAGHHWTTKSIAQLCRGKTAVCHITDTTLIVQWVELCCWYQCNHLSLGIPWYHFPSRRQSWYLPRRHSCGEMAFNIMARVETAHSQVECLVMVMEEYWPDLVHARLTQPWGVASPNLASYSTSSHATTSMLLFELQLKRNH